MRARILIVDDEESIREIMSGMLSPEGYECTVAADGEEAVGILDSGRKFDLVISDLMMPRMDGIEFLEIIKKRYPELPFVMASPCHDRSIMKAALDRGACTYLLEPFEREELYDVVREALASAHSAGSL